MNDNTTSLVNELLHAASHPGYIRPSELPDIDLYMDQVTTFMDARLGQHKRFAHDKVLTKTMINNYAKNDLLPPPVKKKYSREHMLLLTFIYYFKSFLSISDIQSLLRPLTEGCFHKDGENGAGIPLETAYEEVLNLIRSCTPALEATLRETLETAQNSFAGVSGEKQEDLQLFAFICLLSYDVYIRKQLIERLIDRGINPRETSKE